MQPNELISSHNMPFRSFFRGEVNKAAFEISGLGTVKPRGTYDLNLQFTRLPPRFHPIVVTSWSHSVSCATGAESVMGGKSFYDLGIAAYKATRKLTFSSGGVITITADSGLDANGITLRGRIEGTVELNDEPTGLVFYKERLSPGGPGRILTRAFGCIFTYHQPHIDVQVESEYVFDPSLSMPEEQVRHVTELGELAGCTYNSRLTSVVYLDREVQV